MDAAKAFSFCTIYFQHLRLYNCIAAVKQNCYILKQCLTLLSASNQDTIDEEK